MPTLDAIDRKLLYALDENARSSISSLAKQANIHRNVALYRVERMKKEGIIKGFFTEINPLALGMKVFRVFFHFGCATTQEREEFHQFIMHSQRIIWYFDVNGKWDKDVVFIAKTEQEFHTQLQELLFTFNRIIENYELSIMTQLHHFKKDYLLTQKENSGRQGRTFSAVHPPDEKDLVIIKALSNRADIPFHQLVEVTGLSVNTLKERMRELVKQGVILGFRPFIDTSKSGYIYYRLHINLKGHTREDHTKLASFLHSDPHVVYDVNYLNGADIEVEVHLEGPEKLQEFKTRIQDLFGGIVKEIYSMEFSKEWLFRYYPEY